MEQLLTPAEVAAYLEVTEKTLMNWRSLRIGPKPTYAGRWPRYRPSDIDAWLDRQTEILRDWETP